MSELHPRPGDALVVVDLQNDFVTGTLAVPGGPAIVPQLNRAVDAFVHERLPVVATRDWHPADHCSFRDRGGPWPPHCVAETEGAAYAPGLRLPPDTIHVRKGTTRDADAYSGFEGTPLASDLRRRAVTRLFVAGLATDYCVLNTVRDAAGLGFDVVVLSDAIRAVNLRPEDGPQAEASMRAAGARFATVADVIGADVDPPATRLEAPA